MIALQMTAGIEDLLADSIFPQLSLEIEWHYCQQGRECCSNSVKPL
jgi:hypothetical protein